jgi:hypothetical protein
MAMAMEQAASTTDKDFKLQGREHKTRQNKT